MKAFAPILEVEFDLIIIESFGYNPLSQYPLEEGLRKQREILDASVKEIIKNRPQAVVVLMTPIAPNKEMFAKGIYNLSSEVRRQWADERVAYIQNHIDYAKEKNLPLINVFEKSLTVEGDGNLKYINKDDYIHPSLAGVELMSETIAGFIWENRIFPE